MRRGCTPCWIDESGNSVPLERISFSNRDIAEDDIQSALHKTPDLLPIADIDPSFGPLVSLGREIDNIDNLFVSPAGRITLVEAKLWRNPQATREVVAQILDYAVRLSKLSYTDLEQLARTAMSPAPIGDRSLHQLISSAYPEDTLPEQEFVDEVERTLNTGRFLLLVVGDGIRESIENMVAPLHRFPQLLFTFGLVELQVFENPELQNGRLIVPQLVANSQEIVRAVVRVHTTGEAQVSVELEDEAKQTKSQRRQRTLSENEFFEEIRDPATKELFGRLLSASQELGAIAVWRSASVSVRLPDPAGSKQNLTLFVMTTRGELYTGWLPEQLSKLSLPTDVGREYVQAVADLFPDVQVPANEPENLSRNLTAKEVADRFDDFIEVVADFIERVKTASQESMSST